MLNAPGTKRLTLTFDKLLSNVAFNFNLRRYTEADIQGLCAYLSRALQLDTSFTPG
jgi:hypothetical protein